MSLLLLLVWWCHLVVKYGSVEMDLHFVGMGRVLKEGTNQVPTYNVIVY